MIINIVTKIGDRLVLCLGSKDNLEAVKNDIKKPLLKDTKCLYYTFTN